MIEFTKMHGIGNDYVYILDLERRIPDPARLARLVSDRHFGIGSDGLVLIQSDPDADFFMDMYNADGSRGRMCGNAIRCVARYVYERGLKQADRLRIGTLSGVRDLALHIQDGQVESVTVDMGSPALAPADIPVLWTGSRVIDEPFVIGGQSYRVTCVSMGNPHAVVFLPEIDRLDLKHIGPQFENNPMFPDRINTEFVQMTGRQSLRMRVWERGAGETLACGTGACAALVAAVLNERSEREATVHLLGGELKIRWDAVSGRVFMTGPAEFVFDGTLDARWLES